MIDNNVKDSAFTLAEVLITLGIIGVVAAMAIPNLITNTRFHQFRSKVKKTISTLSQVARMSEAQYGFDYSGINQTCGSNAQDENPEETMSFCAMINGTLTGTTYYKKASNIKVKKNNTEENYSITYNSSFFKGFQSLATLSAAFAYRLSDGTLIVVSSNLGKAVCTMDDTATLSDNFNSGDMRWCAGFIDVNGPDLPNTEVSCSRGTNSLSYNDCIVENDSEHLTDIYPIRFHDGVVEPATAAGRYVLRTTK